MQFYLKHLFDTVDINEIKIFLTPGNG